MINHGVLRALAPLMISLGTDCCVVLILTRKDDLMRSFIKDFGVNIVWL